MEFLAIILLAAAVIHGDWMHRRQEKAMLHEHKAERQLLVNQILHLSNHPWQEAPAAKAWEPPEVPNYMISPEQDLDLVP